VGLKHFQHAIEERLSQWINELQDRADERQSDFRECELLIQHSLRLSNRYKRLSCLTIEAMLELEREITDEERRHRAYEEQMETIRDVQIPAIQRDTQNMRKLGSLLEHFIQKAESKRFEEELSFQNQLNMDNNS
jgi:hypothetical protein